jgi:class 3 adenylate cyclase/tetratricopeptide (TPR) repeat protein
VIKKVRIAWRTGEPMRCSKCGSENLAGKKFCGDCGAPLENRCAKCGGDNPSGKRFCGDCGATLADADAATVTDVAPIAVFPAGERRHLTVLFCDLVGSTEIVAQLDPEEWREVVAGYHRAAAEAITRFGGHVAQYQGDGVMAYFGYPEAHDNDAERAARAGLAIVDAIAKLNQQPARPELSARIGIDSGAVVVGASAGRDADVFGDTPNIAARVQTAADPGTVLITADTHRLISGLFVVEDRGAQALKGVQRPVQLYRVIQPSGVRGRLEAAASMRALTPFVGREDELRSLMNRWERAVDAEGQVALIIGEAGIGKSRLVQRFHEQIAGAPHTWIEASAGAFFQNTPFYSVTELLQQFLGGNGGKSAEEQLAQLEPQLELAGLKPADTIPLIAPLLNLPLSDKYPPLPLSPEQKRRRLLATLVEWLLSAARKQPLIVAIEDLHWVDPSTLELIQLLVQQGATAPLMLLYTARPEFRAQWPPRAHHTQITLNRLNARNVRSIVEEVAAQKALSEETIATVVERTGGVPLFVEELTRAVLESGGGKLSGREIPVTLHDSLMARLDRLGQAKEVAQVGAVIGSEFSYELLHAVYPIGEEELQRALHSLGDAELVYVRGIAPEATYQFKHVLIRDAAYEALLKTRRRELHRLVACTLDERFPAVKHTHPEVLARHWTEAGEAEQAISEWSRAGEASYARGAFGEAMESCQQAFAMMNSLPDSPEHIARELELRRTVFSMLWVTRGFSPETIAAGERAAALAEKSGDLAQLCNWIRSRCLAALNAGDLRTATTLGDQALELALREGSPNSVGRAHMLQLNTCFWRGDLAGVEKHFAAALEFFDHPGLTHYPGSAVFTLSIASWNAWMLGRAELARERKARMIATASGKSAYDLTLSWIDAAQLHAYMREYQEAETLAARGLELAEQHQFPYLTAFSRCILGRTRAQLGLADDGVALIRQGLAALFETGVHSRISNYTAYLAEAQARQGAVDEALETVDRALQVNPDELAYRPEILSVRGELRLKTGQAQSAVGDFQESIKLARSMGAKSWELRGTMSLARLLRDTGRRDEARAMLAEIYGWFTEGFDTADLKDAKALLDELAG